MWKPGCPSEPHSSTLPMVQKPCVRRWGHHWMLESKKVSVSVSVVSDSFQPRGLQPTRLLRPWGFPGKNTGVGCHFLLQALDACPVVNWADILPLTSLFHLVDAPPLAGISGGEKAREYRIWRTQTPIPAPSVYLSLLLLSFFSFLFCLQLKFLWRLSSGKNTLCIILCFRHSIKN